MDFPFVTIIFWYSGRQELLAFVKSILLLIIDRLGYVPKLSMNVKWKYKNAFVMAHDFRKV